MNSRPKSANESASWATRVLGVQAISLLIAVPVALAVTWYSSIDLRERMIFRALDGQCDPGTDVNGHCFGDFSSFMGWRAAQQYGSQSPPALRWVLAGFSTVYEYSPGLSLSIYLLVAAGSLITIAVWASRGLPWPVAGFVVGALSVWTLPFWAAIDRGNPALFVAPLILLFLVSFIRTSSGWAGFAVVAMAQIRPQFGLLVLAFAVVGRWRTFALTGITAVAVYLISFVSLGASSRDQFIQSIANMFRHGAIQPISEGWPTNISFGRAVALLIGPIHRFYDVDISDVLTPYSTLIGAVFALVTMAAMFLRRRVVPTWQVALAFPILAALLPGTTFSYYWVIALPVVAVLVRSPSHLMDSGPRLPQGLLDTFQSPDGKTRNWLLVITASICISPVFVPYGTIEDLGTTAFNLSLLPVAGTLGWMTWLTLWIVRPLANAKTPRGEDFESVLR